MSIFFWFLELGGGVWRTVRGRKGGGTLYSALSNWVSVDMMCGRLFGGKFQVKRITRVILELNRAKDG